MQFHIVLARIDRGKFKVKSMKRNVVSGEQVKLTVKQTRTVAPDIEQKTLAGDEAFEVVEVEIASTGAVHVIAANQSIIEVLEAAGMELMYDCQRGDCGICQTDVVSGIPDHRDVVLSDEEKATGQVMQICVSRAKSKRLVLDL